MPYCFGYFYMAKSVKKQETKTTENTFFDQYKDPRWQKKRLEVLEAFNYSCLFCGEKHKTLHVHHVYYVSGRSVWEYEICELMVLCDECHASVHTLKDQLSKQVFTLHLQTQRALLKLILRLREVASENGSTIESMLLNLCGLVNSICPNKETSRRKQ
jgi:hypothetical protein